MFNIAPKRPNWDLKRETEKKLARLERKTQEAIHTLISEWVPRHRDTMVMRRVNRTATGGTKGTVGRRDGGDERTGAGVWRGRRGGGGVALYILYLARGRVLKALRQLSIIPL